MNTKTFLLGASSWLIAGIYILGALVIVPWALITADEGSREVVRAHNVITAEAQIVPVAEVVTVTEEPELVSLGEFKIYHYCPCRKCTPGNNITATGTVPEAGRTIAVDPEVIPLGSVVIIDGHEYTAEDTGGGIKGRKIDLFVNDHQEALNLGIKRDEVFIYGKK